MNRTFYSDEELIANATLRMYGYDIHTHTEMNLLNRSMPWYTMSYVSEGTALLRVDGREYEQRPGDVMFLPPNVVHDHIKTGEGKTTFLWWHFDYKVFNVIDLFRLINVPVLFRLNRSAEFEKIFYEYMDVMHQEPSLKTMALRRAKMLEVLAYLFEAAELAHSTHVTHSVPDDFKQMIQDVITATEQRLSLSDLARQYNLNATYLSNRFKAYFGISPIAMHRQLQVERAKYLLGTKHLSVGEVAERLGYTDPAVFSRFFTQKAGIAPSQVTDTKWINSPE